MPPQISPAAEDTAATNALAAARAAFADGDADRAMMLCEQAVQARPDGADAWHLMGVLAYQRGEASTAVDLLGRAIQLAPRVAEYHNDLGVVAQSTGAHAAALKRFEEAVRLDPAALEPRVNLVWALMDAERLADAQKVARPLRDRADADALVAAAAPEVRLSNAQAALTLLGRALGTAPDHPEAQSWCALALAATGAVGEALAMIRDALAEAPGHAAVLANAGEVYRIAEKSEEALALLERSVKAGTRAARVWISGATVLLSLFRAEDALRWATEATRLAPSCADALNAVGAAHVSAARHKEAVEVLTKALALAPDHASAHLNLLSAYPYLGDVESARRHGRRALALVPSDGLRVQLATTLPLIAPSVDAVEEARARYEDEVERLGREKLSIPDPVTQAGAVMFYLAYHGKNDRDINRKVANLFRFLPRELPLAAAPRARRRVGFCSRFFFQVHAVSICFRWIIQELASRGMDVVLLRPRGSADGAWEGARTVEIPPTLAEAREAIAREDLDVLVYTDLGFDPLTYYLAFTRLAPVQCVMGGHPVTSGIPSIDHYLSVEDLEGPGADAHYTENLVRFEGVSIYLPRPVVSTDVTRAELADERTLFVCPMTLHKVHPQMDAAFGEILRRVPRARLVLFKDSRRPWHEVLMRRFHATIPDVVDRIDFLDSMPLETFTAFVGKCDVVLDTFHFGGGSTAYLTLAAGTPVVTWETEFQRCRLYAALLRRLGLGDEVARDARDYVEKAVALGLDRDRRRHVREQILARNGELYDRREIVDEIARFVSEVRPR